MNIEVEVKLKIENRNEVREKVASLGKFVKSIKQIDEYYIPSHRDFFAQKPHPLEWMRIITEPDRVIFGYYRSISTEIEKERGRVDEEYESEITNYEDFKKTLEFLDFKKIITVTKEREYWEYGKLEIALDKIKELGDFIEVEAKGDFKSDKEAKSACVSLLHKLGIENTDDKELWEGYAEMVLNKKL